MMYESVMKIIQEVVKDTDIIINSTDSLLEIGIDSLNMIELVVGIENEFDFELLDADLIIENFQSIDSIINLLVAYESKGLVTLAKYQMEVSQ